MPSKFFSSGEVALIRWCGQRMAVFNARAADFDAEIRAGNSPGTVARHVAAELACSPDSVNSIAARIRSSVNALRRSQGRPTLIEEIIAERQAA